MGKILLLIYLWSIRELRTTAAEMLRLTKNTVSIVYSLLRYYCTRDLQDRPVIPFSGNMYVAKCDKSQFKHESKVSCIEGNYRSSLYCESRSSIVARRTVQMALKLL